MLYEKKVGKGGKGDSEYWPGLTFKIHAARDPVPVIVRIFLPAFCIALFLLSTFRCKTFDSALFCMILC